MNFVSKNKFFIPLVVLMTGLAASTGGADETQVLTLQESYQKALQQSESVAMSEQNIRIAEGHYLEALGSVLPHISVKASELLQDTSGDTSAGGSSVGSTFTRRSRPEVAINLKQPLFQGFREFRALKVSGAEKKEDAFQVERAKQLLFFDVARAYYAVLQLEDQLKILESIRSVTQKRSRDLHERIRLGKSRESERLTVESQLASQEAEIEKVRGLIDSAHEMLGFLIGEPVQKKLGDHFQVPAHTAPLSTYLAALKTRPDIKATGEGIRLSKGKLDYEKGGLLPTVNLESNYYPYRVGFASDIKWDVLLTLNFPLFEGGARRGLIKEASAGLRQSELYHQATARAAERDVREAYHNLVASLRREEALRIAASKAQENYQSQVGEYRLGLVNNLDTLQALRDWEEQRLNDNASHYETKLNYLQLKISSGDLNLEGLLK